MYLKILKKLEQIYVEWIIKTYKITPSKICLNLYYYQSIF
ncbi:Hypothetical protein MLEA_004750 [Mycoplasma leachii 99/014/6]|nr:Hypothetical protein MLEA_004750 [Mycoplasma leachii 99/014/6]